MSIAIAVKKTPLENMVNDFGIAFGTNRFIMRYRMHLSKWQAQ